MWGVGSLMGASGWRSPLGMYPWMSTSGMWRSSPLMRMAAAGSSSTSVPSAASASLPASATAEKIPVLSIAQPLVSVPQTAMNMAQSAMNVPHAAMNVAQNAMNIPQNVVNMPKVPSGEEILSHMVLANQNSKPFVDTISDFFYSPDQIKARHAIVTPLYITGINSGMKSASNVANAMDDCNQPEMARWNRDMAEWVF
ncbi:hypothetical protein RUM43_001062 [Polyplax serrata]|uniref:Uncharacterized protein n=1 Tax=Polyplax serrata TaxID=468196 RepID=A0AAN8SEB7_POLSC